MTLHRSHEFAARISRAFGEEGTAWLTRLPQILHRCQERWQLTHLRVLEDLSYNLVCFAESPTYGPVVLKVGMPHPELWTEKKALSLYAGRGICTCYETDAELGALLLERIVPGTDLTSVANHQERFRLAASLISFLPVVPKGEHGLPTYEDWLTRAFARVRAEQSRNSALRSLVDKAEGLFEKLDTPRRPKLLLHGDLHHKNILKDCQGWKAIDPKGVIGVHCLEAARFMQNEFGMGDDADRLQRLDEMIATFAEHLGERKSVLAGCAFIDQVLATCWSAEENLPLVALHALVEECQTLFDYLQRQTP